MKRWLRELPVLGMIVLAVVVGCETFYERPEGGGGGSSATGLLTTPDSSGPEGVFAEVGPDVVDQRPEPVDVDEEGEETFSNFRAIQIDPVAEDSAGPKFAATFDIDNDGLPDLLTGWNESQPVQAHFQRRDENGNVTFVAVTLGGTAPIAIIGGLTMADFDQDGWLDAAVLIKTTGGAPICPTPGGPEPFEVLGNADDSELQILFSPGNANRVMDGDAWQEVRFSRSQLPGRRDEDEQVARTYPEFNSHAGIAAGEIDGINGPDIVVTFNPATCEFYGDDPPVNRIHFYPNPGGDGTRSPGTIPLTATADAGPDQAVTVPDPATPNPVGVEVTLDASSSFTSQYYGVPSVLWEQVSGPAVQLAGAGSPAPTFTAPTTPAALSFRVSASAGGMTDFDYVNVIVGEPGNVPPTVVSVGDQMVIPDVDDPSATTVVMSAFGSDPDGGSLTYSWQQVYGTPVVLSSTNLPNTSFTAPAAGGELRFRVTVTDGSFFDSDVVVVTSGVWAPIVIDASLARAGDILLSDVDQDGDQDVVYTFPNQITSNISWARNPTIPHDDVSPSGAAASHVAANWQLRPVGQVNTDADRITAGDIDLDGFDDILVRTRVGKAAQWFRHPGAADLEPVFPPPDAVPDRYNFPWQVYTVAEYDFRIPGGIAVGDLTGDGFNEIAVAAGGVIYWYDASSGGNPYDAWEENFVIDDTKSEGVTDDPNDPDFQDNGTVITALTIVDIDGDGYGDVIGTLDRRTLSGLTDDTLIWFRNILGEREEDVTAQ